MARKKLNKLNFCQSFKGGIIATPRFRLLIRGKNKRHNLMYVNEVTRALSALQRWTHRGRLNIISSTDKRICPAITSAHQSKRWWYHLSMQGNFGKWQKTEKSKNGTLQEKRLGNNNSAMQGLILQWMWTAVFSPQCHIWCECSPRLASNRFYTQDTALLAAWCDTENGPVIPQVVFQELDQAPLMFLQWNAAFFLHVCMCEIDSFLGPETTPCCFSSPGQIRPESPRGRWTWRSLWARASCYPVRWPATPSSMSPSPGPSTDSSSPRETATSSWWAGWATAVIHPENVRMDSWHLFPPRSASSLPLD